MNGSSLNGSGVGMTINGHFLTKISKEEVNDLNVQAYNGKITVVKDPKEIKACIRKIKKYSVLGFDTESRPSFRKNQHFEVSLIQIATEKEAFLFRINHTGFHQSLIDLFEDPSIIKVGVSIHDDIKRLKHLKDFQEKGFMELQKYTDEFGIESNSLRKLSAIILGFRISKAQQLSNWEAEKLSEAQCLYGATDAWVSLEIYNKLLKFEPHE